MSSLRLPCPDCNDKASIQLFKDGSFCHACRKQSHTRSLINRKPDVIVDGPKVLQDFSYEIPEAGLNWLRKYRVTEENIYRFDIGWSQEFERLVFPYFVGDEYKFSWMRDVYDRTYPFGMKKVKWLFNGDQNNAVYWFYQKEHSDSIVITEDVVSAIRCSDNQDVLALGGLNFNKEIITEILLGYKELIIWLDGDTAGREAARRFCKKWMLLRKVRKIKTKQDPKCYSSTEIERILNDRD